MSLLGKNLSKAHSCLQLRTVPSPHHTVPLFRHDSLARGHVTRHLPLRMVSQQLSSRRREGTAHFLAKIFQVNHCSTVIFCFISSVLKSFSAM